MAEDRFAQTERDGSDSSAGSGSSDANELAALRNAFPPIAAPLTSPIAALTAD